MASAVGQGVPQAVTDLPHVVIAGAAEVVAALSQEIPRSLGYRVSKARSAAETVAVAEREHVDILIADIQVSDGDPVELQARIKAVSPQTEIVWVTAEASIGAAVRAIKNGASAYLVKPVDVEEAKLQLQRLVEKINVVSENRLLRECLQPGRGWRLQGVSGPMQALFRLIVKASQGRYPVLIVGESGTGKELVARSIHENGPLRDRPFVPVDCTALVPTLIESELFGYARGAFTGASTKREGLLEAAQAGTVFFDEIGELPLEAQTKLLRALQEREIRPVGSNRRVPFEARVLAATNRDLETAIQQGTFRRDLYYRLNVVKLKVPALRERRTDIAALARHFLAQLVPEERRRPVLSQEAVECLTVYDWPGNVRELENCMQRAAALNSGPVLRISDLPSTLQNRRGMAAAAAAGAEPVVPLADIERQAILRAVAAADGDKVKAARMLGIGKTTLYRKLKEYGVK